VIFAENVKLFTRGLSRNAGGQGAQVSRPWDLWEPARYALTSRMLAIPQVDIRGGSCVRPSLEPGDRGSGGAPIGEALDVARSWAAIGFHRIHVVDRDAIAGHGSNELLVETIVRDGTVEVQIDDAAESADEIERLVSAGATRIVLGTRWLEEPDWLASAADLYPGLLIVAADIRERRVVTRGWLRSLPTAILDVVGDLSGVPLGGFLVSTGAGGNGHRSGADLALIEDIADASDVPVIVEGGIHAVNDLRALEHRGVSAVLLGDPLYRGELDARSVAMEFGED
jgi:phosphoribosylformimino-5-aminoimidazole carboxamide ribotide isomerase